MFKFALTLTLACFAVVTQAKTLSQPGYGFSLTYPDSWQPLPTSGYVAALGINAVSYMYIESAFLEDYLDPGQKDLTSAQKLEAHVRSQEKLMASNMEGFKQRESIKTSFIGLPALGYEYSSTWQGRSYITREINFIQDKQVLKLSFASLAQQYTQEKPKFDAILQSVKALPTPPGEQDNKVYSVPDYGYSHAFPATWQRVLVSRNAQQYTAMFSQSSLSVSGTSSSLSQPQAPEVFFSTIVQNPQILSENKISNLKMLGEFIKNALEKENKQKCTNVSVKTTVIVGNDFTDVQCSFSREKTLYNFRVLGSYLGGRVYQINYGFNESKRKVYAPLLERLLKTVQFF